MSSPSNILSSVPPAAWPLGVGLLVTSSLSFGNLGLAFAGPLPIIKEELGVSNLNPQAKVRVWKLFFDAATKYVVPGGFITAVLHLSVPFLSPSSTVRALALSSAACSVGAIVYTVIAILPTNKKLLAMDQQDELNALETKQAETLIAKWDYLHKWRCVIYYGAWATGLAALFAVVQ